MAESFQSCKVGSRLVMVFENLPRPRPQIDQDFGNSKETDHDGSQANTVAQHQNIEREARLAGDGIETDAGEQAAEERHQQALSIGPCAE